MKLPYFLEPVYDELFSAIEANQDHYMNNDPDWLNIVFSDRHYSKESTIEIQKPTLIEMDFSKDDSLKSQEDLANVRIMFDALGVLTPLQATNKYLWTYLSHITYKDYIFHRWLSSPTDVPVRTIRTRFFVTSNANTLYDNAISRLWWYGYISYDEGNPNPYHLTEILLMNQTICSDFVDTRYCHNRTIGKGVLLALKEFAGRLGPREGITDYFREFNKYFNRYGAVSSLDFLSSEDVYEIALNYMIQAREKRTSSKASK